MNNISGNRCVPSKYPGIRVDPSAKPCTVTGNYTFRSDAMDIEFPYGVHLLDAPIKLHPDDRIVGVDGDRDTDDDGDPRTGTDPDGPGDNGPLPGG